MPVLSSGFACPRAHRNILVRSRGPITGGYRTAAHELGESDESLGLARTALAYRKTVDCLTDGDVRDSL